MARVKAEGHPGLLNIILFARIEKAAGKTHSNLDGPDSGPDRENKNDELR